MYLYRRRLNYFVVFLRLDSSLLEHLYHYPAFTTHPPACQLTFSLLISYAPTNHSEYQRFRMIKVDYFAFDPSIMVAGKNPYQVFCYFRPPWGGSSVLLQHHDI